MPFDSPDGAKRGAKRFSLPVCADVDLQGKEVMGGV